MSAAPGAGAAETSDRAGDVPPWSGDADPERLTAMLDELAAITTDPVGITRLAYSQAEREAHRLVAGWLRDLGMEVHVDAAGNTIAELAGSAAGPAIATGSHLDSVPGGGRFDGAAGVVAGVEAVRILREHGICLDRPLRVVAFAAEEGARFGQACLGSRCAAGLTTTADAHRLTDADGTPMAVAMRSVGLDPTALADSVWRRDDWAGFIELHVEQGAVLEARGEHIGVVDLVSGSTRFELHFEGRASHSGSTPMSIRADAMVAAAECIVDADRMARGPRHRGTRTTVGRVEVLPGSITTIPGSVRVSVDVRDVDSDRQRETALDLVARAEAASRRRGVTVTARLLGDASPTVLPIWMRDVLTRACGRSDTSYRVMTSGASHDAQAINRVVPAGLLFVPSRAGLSHVPEEWTSATDLARGVDLLRDAIVELDDVITGFDGQHA